MIILYAGTPNAEVVFRALSCSGDYHGEMNHKMIVRWLEDKLIPYLPPKCVLVMDTTASRQTSCQGNQETPDTRVVDQARYQMIRWHVKR